MLTSPSFGPRDRQGYALLITLVFLAITLTTLASLMWWASSNGKVTQKNELFTTAGAAADAAAETVVATMDRDWTYGQALQSASVYSHLSLPVQTTWPMQFQYSDGSGNNGVIGVSIAITNNYGPVGSEFAGLSGYLLPCTIVSTATTLNQTYTVSATVQELINATVIPLFQFAIFYNMNLEIDPGAAMVITGPVFCNQGIWAGTPNVTFGSSVSAVGWVYDQATDPTNDDPWASGKTDTGTPSGNFSIQPLFGRDSLSLPIGNSTNNNPAAVEAIINLPVGTNGAPNPYAYSTNGQAYLFNESDLIISNAAAGLAGIGSVSNLTIWFQDPNNPTSYLSPVTNDFYALKKPFGTTNSISVLSTNSGYFNITNVAYTGYSFVTNVSYYDYREADTVQAVQVDVGKLNVWVTNTAATGGNQYNRTSFHDNGHGIRSIYVYNNVPKTASQLPAVRMINGAQLPFTTDPGGSGATTSGLTVSTPQPLYVKDDYNVQTAASAAGASAQTTNTASTYPAALIGDAISILSGSWSDANNASTLLAARTPSPTTINAAALEGIVQSTNSNYSGGVENFLRLNENWSGVTLQYNGSIVVMFPSIYATSPWPGTGNNFYNPPTRHWAFDLNFTDPKKLPALTPKVFRMIRATWRDF
jgi:hypothetical protein